MATMHRLDAAAIYHAGQHRCSEVHKSFTDEGTIDVIAPTALKLQYLLACFIGASTANLLYRINLRL